MINLEYSKIPFFFLMKIANNDLVFENHQKIITQPDKKSVLFIRKVINKIEQHWNYQKNEEFWKNLYISTSKY